MKVKKQSVNNSQKTAAYFFILPALILLILFLVCPMVTSFRYSFTDYNIMRPDRISFNGIDNYIELIKDSNFLKAIINTFEFAIKVVPLQCVLALALAMFVNNQLKGVSIFRTAYFSPQVTSMVVIAILWVVLYNSNPSSGLLNAILVKIGIEPIGFLTNPKAAMNSIVFMSAWQGAGYQMMILLAGLQAIPGEHYEAASIDGAAKWQSFFYITLPGLRNVIKYVIMITTIQALKLFTQPYVMTQGGPQNSTKTIVYYIYEQGFQNRNFGYACAIAVLFLIIVIGIALGLKRVINAE